MNLPTIIVLLIVAAGVVLALRKVKRGGSCSCHNCPGNCHQCGR